MIDAQRLLDQFLGSGKGRPGSTGASGGSLPGGLDKIIGGALGGSGARGSQGGGSFSGGLSDIAGSLGRGGVGTAGASALAGGLAGYLLKGKGAKKLGGTALKVGGLALVAGLGYKAWQNYQAQQGQGGPVGGHSPQGVNAQGQLPRPVSEEVPSAEGTRFLPAESEADARARLLLSAMIAAAKADGYIDREEEEAIFGKVDDLQLDSEEKGLLMDEMRRPKSIDELVAAATSPEVAVEIYLASILAVDADHPAERAYLDFLASRLGLEPDLVAEIRRTAEEAQATA
ncbi:tellurite resistance TerB family protein [Aureimonas mangrovi]|uniref:tellurite resistance TerB family protein n=1 Tax=Aureimonas mangrovi TaxID=2758041 RepID=UPI00163D5270|nr:tellurite resistance TerB family protein [Aureimonas mangrovi]